MVKSEWYTYCSLRSSALAMLACAEIARNAYTTLGAEDARKAISLCAYVLVRKSLAMHIPL